MFIAEINIQILNLHFPPDHLPAAASWENEMRPQKEALLHWTGAGMRRLLLILDNNKHEGARGGHNEEELHEKLRKLSIKLSEKGQQQQQNQQQPSESTEKMNNLLIFSPRFSFFLKSAFFSPFSDRSIWGSSRRQRRRKFGICLIQYSTGGRLCIAS